MAEVVGGEVTLGSHRGHEVGKPTCRETGRELRATHFDTPNNSCIQAPWQMSSSKQKNGCLNSYVSSYIKLTFLFKMIICMTQTEGDIVSVKCTQ